MNQIVENLKKNPSLLVGVVALIVCLGFGFFRSNQLGRLSDEESELNAKLDKMSLNLKNSDNIDQDIQELNTLVSAIDERLFVRDERSISIDFFYSFEEKLDIKVSEVKQLENSNRRYTKEGPDELKLYSVIDYDITISGDFREILSFFYEIYQIDAIARLTEFQIDNSNAYGDSGKLSAKVQVAVLAQK